MRRLIRKVVRWLDAISAWLDGDDFDDLYGGDATLCRCDECKAANWHAHGDGDPDGAYFREMDKR